MVEPGQVEDSVVESRRAEKRTSEPNPRLADEATAAEAEPERVAQRAYELYLERGAEDGKAMDDWLIAERELTGTRGSSGE
jgi:hypothetical protein